MHCTDNSTFYKPQLCSDIESLCTVSLSLGWSWKKQDTGQSWTFFLNYRNYLVKDGQSSIVQLTGFLKTNPIISYLQNRPNWTWHYCSLRYGYLFRSHPRRCESSSSRYTRSQIQGMSSCPFLINCLIGLHFYEW